MPPATAVLLCALAAAASAPAPAPRTRWAGAQVNLLGSPSRDGALLSFSDTRTGALSIRDLAARSCRAVASRPGGSREFAYFSVFSPDAKRIAFAWRNGQGFYDLRVASTSGAGQPRVLYSNEEAGFVQPSAWTPDGKQILTLLFRRDNISQIVLIPAAGGAPRLLRSLDWVYPKKMDISPDGRWIVYDNFAAEGRPERTIFALSTSGARETRLVAMEGNYVFPLWAPGGRSIVFSGDRGGSPALWALDVEDGRAKGEPWRIADSLGRILPLGITAAGEFFYGARTGETDVYVARKQAAQPRFAPIGSRFRGRNSAPAWSGDGQRIAFLSRRGTENFGEDARAIVVLDTESGDEHEVAAHLSQIERLRWSPDGESLLASGSDGKGRGGVFLVRVADGRTSPVAADRDAPHTGYEAEWAADGKAVFYLNSASELRRHSLGDGSETVLLNARGMQHLAADPRGGRLAVGVGGMAIRITPLASGAPARLLPFAGLTELAWAGELYAGRGEELWAIPPDGAPARRVPLPAHLPGIAVNPRDGSIAFAAGGELSEVRSLRLALP